jgi:broad specificity phosphatase PhoE
LRQLLLRSLDHDELPALRVARAAGEPAGVEDPTLDLGRDRRRSVVADVALARDRQPGLHGQNHAVLELIYEPHATTLDNEAGIATGWLPGELSETGRGQALELGARRRDVDAVFSSDLGRALETVAIAFFGSDVPIFHDWRLRECDYGALNGAPRAELELAKHLEMPFPGGESYADVLARLESFVHDLRRSWDGKRVLVVSHAAPLWALQQLLEGRALDPGWEFRL